VRAKFIPHRALDTQSIYCVIYDQCVSCIKVRPKKAVSTTSKSSLKDLTYRITRAAIEVHKILGPGLPESVYQKCLKKELDDRGISFESELLIEMNYKGHCFDTQLRCDLLVEKIIVVELW
jgi:hypothetical protein